jgi:ribosomal protein L29
MNKEQRIRKLEEFKQKLFTVKSELASGGSIQNPGIQNPGQIQEYKKAIARILSIMTELDEI